MRRTTYLIVLLLCAGLQGSALADQLLLSQSGFGRIQFGAKLSAVEAELKEVATPKNREASCDFVRFKTYPGIRFVVEDGVITRADASGSIRNTTGINRGMSLARAKALHPGIQIEPHKYDDAGHYLILPTSDKRSAFVFEESKGKIKEVRAGLQPSVQYVEGCS